MEWNSPQGVRPSQRCRTPLPPLLAPMESNEPRTWLQCHRGRTCCWEGGTDKERGIGGVMEPFPSVSNGVGGEKKGGVLPALGRKNQTGEGGIEALNGGGDRGGFGVFFAGGGGIWAGGVSSSP